MASQNISRLGKVLSAGPPATAYERLKECGFLAAKGLDESESVVRLLKKEEDAWPSSPPTGDELWRHMEKALANRRYLSDAGIEASKEYVPRW